MWGVWSNQDGGLVDGPFGTFVSAQEACSGAGGDADELEVLEICPDHDDEPRQYCEEC